MAKVTFLSGNMCAMNFVKELPTIVFEELTEDNELGVTIKTFSLKEDVQMALSRAFRERTITVYYDDELIYENYFCERCGRIDRHRYIIGCCFTETYTYAYDEDDEI